MKIMSSYIFTELDKEVNGDKPMSIEKSIENVVNKHIIKKIDPTFPLDLFKEWADSDSDEPFRWNKNRYYWF